MLGGFYKKGKLIMRKVFFTAILLLVFGTVWVLYLEYDNRRFIESLPKPPVVNPAEAPVTSENTESTAIGQMQSVSGAANTFTESEHIHPHPHPHTKKIEPTEVSENPSETLVFEDVVDNIPAHPKEESLLEKREHTGVEIDKRAVEMEERWRAWETLKRIISQDRIEGPPGKDGSFVVTITDENDFQEALDKLSKGPPPAGLRLPPRKTRKATGTRIVKFRGMELHLPDFKDLPAQAR